MDLPVVTVDFSHALAFGFYLRFQEHVVFVNPTALRVIQPLEAEPLFPMNELLTHDDYQKLQGEMDSASCHVHLSVKPDIPDTEAVVDLFPPLPKTSLAWQRELGQPRTPIQSAIRTVKTVRHVPAAPMATAVAAASVVPQTPIAPANTATESSKEEEDWTRVSSKPGRKYAEEFYLVPLMGGPVEPLPSAPTRAPRPNGTPLAKAKTGKTKKRKEKATAEAVVYHPFPPTHDRMAWIRGVLDLTKENGTFYLTEEHLLAYYGPNVVDRLQQKILEEIGYYKYPVRKVGRESATLVTDHTMVSACHALDRATQTTSWTAADVARCIVNSSPGSADREAGVFYFEYPPHLYGPLFKWLADRNRSATFATDEVPDEEAQAFLVIGQAMIKGITCLNRLQIMDEALWLVPEAYRQVGRVTTWSLAATMVYVTTVSIQPIWNHTMSGNMIRYLNAMLLIWRLFARTCRLSTPLVTTLEENDKYYFHFLDYLASLEMIRYLEAPEMTRLIMRKDQLLECMKEEPYLRDAHLSWTTPEEYNTLIDARDRRLLPFFHELKARALPRMANELNTRLATLPQSE